MSCFKVFDVLKFFFFNVVRLWMERHARGPCSTWICGRTADRVFQNPSTPAALRLEFRLLRCRTGMIGGWWSCVLINSRTHLVVGLAAAYSASALTEMQWHTFFGIFFIGLELALFPYFISYKRHLLVFYIRMIVYTSLRLLFTSFWTYAQRQRSQNRTDTFQS